MNYKEFEKELQQIDSGFSIKENPSRRATDGNKVGICNIFYNGKSYDLPPIPEEIKDDIDVNYYYTFPAGMSARFWSKSEVLSRLHKFLEDFKNGEYEGLDY